MVASHPGPLLLLTLWKKMEKQAVEFALGCRFCSIQQQGRRTGRDKVSGSEVLKKLVINGM